MTAQFQEWPTIKLETETPKVGKFKDKTVCFTGKLNLTRNEAAKIIKKMGGKVSNSLTKSTHYLICGDEPGSKVKEASKKGIEIINKKEWNKIVKQFKK